MVKKRSRPTIIDVARLAGVSVGSVSHVLNGSKPASEPMREQIMRAAEALGYQANSVARTLRNQRSNVIGLCVPDTASAYLNDLANELDMITMEHGYELIHALTRHDPVLELQRVKSLLGRQTDALILLPSLKPQPSLNLMHRAGIAAAIVDRRVEDDRFSSVTLNNYAAMRDLVQMLAGLGHRHFLFVVRFLQVITTRDRNTSLQDQVNNSGGGLTAQTIEMNPDSELFLERIREIMQRPQRPTAIIMGNSIVAVATINALRKIGVRCPEDVALATFDDPHWATAMTPPLTTIKTPTRAMARAVWSLIEAQLNGTMTEPRSVEIMTEISQRASSARPWSPPQPAGALETSGDDGVGGPGASSR